MFDLLTESLVPVVSNRAREAELVTLPELFSRLAERLRRRPPRIGQRTKRKPGISSWLSSARLLCIVQAAKDLPGASKDWRAALAELTPDCADTAWSLVVENASEPALLQPPTKRVDKFKLAAETPDALDVLVTAKNHDRKQAQATAAPPHFWLYALATLQTSQGYSGRGNPGIARMNGGLASRVLVDRRPERAMGTADRAIHTHAPHSSFGAA